MALRSLALAAKEMQILLKRKGNMLPLRTQPKSDLVPMGGGFGDLFKIQTIIKNWEVIPVVLTGLVCIIFPVYHITHRLSKAEDISFKPGTKMKNQKHRWILEGPPKPTLYMVRNQKWVWPQGLLDALAEDKEEDNEDNSDAKCKKVKYKSPK